MKISRKAQRHHKCVFIMFVCCLFPGMLTARSISDPLLELLPADCLMCMRINQLDKTLNSLGQYLAGVAPMDVNGMARMQLMGILGNMNLAGINMTGDFGAYVPTPSMEQEGMKAMQRPPLILIPVSDYQQFITASTNVSEPDDKGVSMMGEGVLITQVGTYALLQPKGTAEQLLSTASVLKQNKKSLASGFTPEEMASAQKQGLWVYVNIPLIAKTMGPELVAKVKSTGTFIEQRAKMVDPNAMTMGDVKTGFEMYARILDTLLKEAGALTVQADADGKALGVGLSLSALPNTTLHECLALTTAGQPNETLLGYLQDGAMMNFVFHGDPAHMAKLNAKMIELFMLSGESVLDEKALTDMQTMVDKMAQAMGRTMVFSMDTDTDVKPPFKGVFAFEAKGEKAYEEMLTANADFIKNPVMAKMMEEQGLELSIKNQKAVDKHQDVAIHSYMFSIKATDPNAPQAPFISAIYGDGFEIRWAVLGDVGLAAMGTDAHEKIKTLIDEAKSGVVPSIGSEFKEAMTLIPHANQANIIITYNFLRVMKMIPAIMPMPIPLPPIDFPTKSNLVMAGSAHEGTAHYQMILPKTHLMEIKQAFQQMQQQQMQMQQQGVPQPGTPMPTMPVH